MVVRFVFGLVRGTVAYMRLISFQSSYSLPFLEVGDVDRYIEDEVVFLLLL